MTMHDELCAAETLCSMGNFCVYFHNSTTPHFGV